MAPQIENTTKYKKLITQVALKLGNTINHIFCYIIYKKHRIVLYFLV